MAPKPEKRPAEKKPATAEKAPSAAEGTKAVTKFTSS